MSLQQEENTGLTVAGWFIPLAFLIHFAEEWYLGLPAWVQTVFGVEIGQPEFLMINATGLGIFLCGTIAAMLIPSMRFLAVSFATLFGLNSILHLLGTLVFGYSPGTFTGLIVYIPLSILILRSGIRLLPARTFWVAVFIGILLHATATFSAINTS